MWRVIGVVLTVVGLAGCGNLQNVTVNDLRTQHSLRTQGVLEMSIPQIQEALYRYSNMCRSLGQLDIDPQNVGAAHYTAYMPGLTRSSAAMLIDFTQKDEHHTAYRGYSYYKTWSSKINDVIDAITNPSKCIN